MILQKQDCRQSIQKYCGFTSDTPWSVTKVDHTYKGTKNSKFSTEGSSPFNGTSPAIRWVVEFMFIKLMTMLKECDVLFSRVFLDYDFLAFPNLGHLYFP